MTIMWSVLCTLLVVSAWAIHSALSGVGIRFGAWHWAGLLTWLLWTFFGVAVVWTSLTEREARAAAVSAVLFGAGSIGSAYLLLTLARANQG